MLLLAGIITVAVVVLVLAVVFERTRSREAEAAAATLLERARRRTESHLARLNDVVRTARFERDAGANRGGPGTPSQPSSSSR